MTHLTTSTDVRAVALQVGASGRRVETALHAPAVTPEVRKRMRAELRSLSKAVNQLARML